MDENWPSKRVWKMVESQGKVSEKSGNFEMDIEWQRCFEQPTYIEGGVGGGSR